ncbi:Regulatory protein RecX [Gammaproteobacteria bacterium]
MSAEDRAAAHTKALELLARREHSRGELRTKLRTRGFSAEDAETAIADLADKGFQSDDRFLEAFVEGRAARGQGPLKIAAELRTRGVTGETVESTIDTSAQRWRDSAYTVRKRRFGVEPPTDARERAAQMRFLAQRGFNSEQIRAAFTVTDE